MKWLRRWFCSLPAAPIDAALWHMQLARIVGAQDLSLEQQRRWHALVERFLADKIFSPVDGCVLEPADRLLIAMLCCQPVLDLGYDWLRGWREIVVYPGAFGMRRQHLDEDSGLLHEWDDVLVGECWERGPLILSLEDVLQAALQPTSGYHVVVHEIAHKLDLLDGRLDGVPPLRDATWRQRWILDFQHTFDQLCGTLEAGGDALIDPYAATAPDEFFAVCSEYHFTDPGLLAEAMPAVAMHLARFYHPERFTAPG